MSSSPRPVPLPESEAGPMAGSLTTVIANEDPAADVDDHVAAGSVAERIGQPAFRFQPEVVPSF
jgi:hypothetical protein